MDHYGPIVRYVEDAALMLDVMKGYHPADPYSIPDDSTNYLKVLDEKPKKLKIGYSMTLGFGKSLEEEVRENILKSAKKFEKFGWEVEEAKFKIRSPEFAFKTLVGIGYAYDFQKDYNDRIEELTPDIRSTIRLGLDCNVLSIGKAQEQTKKLYGVFCKYFQNYDLLITPTTPCPAFAPGWSESGTVFPKVGKKSLNVVTWMNFTYPFNMTGLPAASIPSGWTASGLPIGMQIIGRRYDEKTVLQASKAFEEIAPLQDKKPKFNLN